MRLWSIHPRYLDAKGLVGLWREGLLAQKILCGESSAYAKHPQLIRFRAATDPQAAIAAYLTEVWEEGNRRGYRFDRKRIRKCGKAAPLPVTEGQIEFERRWLESKLKRRCPSKLCGLPSERAKCHPSFFIVRGGKERWEKGNLNAPIDATKSRTRAKSRAANCGGSGRRTL